MFLSFTQSLRNWWPTRSFFVSFSFQCVVLMLLFVWTRPIFKMMIFFCIVVVGTVDGPLLSSFTWVKTRPPASSTLLSVSLFGCLTQPRYSYMGTSWLCSFPELLIVDGLCYTPLLMSIPSCTHLFCSNHPNLIGPDHPPTPPLLVKYNCLRSLWK